MSSPCRRKPVSFACSVPRLPGKQKSFPLWTVAPSKASLDSKYIATLGGGEQRGQGGTGVRVGPCFQKRQFADSSKHPSEGHRYTGRSARATQAWFSQVESPGPQPKFYLRGSFF